MREKKKARYAENARVQVLSERVRARRECGSVDAAGLDVPFGRWAQPPRKYEAMADNRPRGHQQQGAEGDDEEPVDEG